MSKTFKRFVQTADDERRSGALQHYSSHLQLQMCSCQQLPDTAVVRDKRARRLEIVCCQAASPRRETMSAMGMQTRARCWGAGLRSCLHM